MDIDNALIDAANRGDAAACREALERGANVHAGNDEALWWAAEHGHPDVVRLLLDAGANVHAADGSALWGAANNGHFVVAGALIQAGAFLGPPFVRVKVQEWNPDALSFMLDTPGCLSIEDAEYLRRQVLDSSSSRLEPLRQRLKLRDGAAATCTPAGLEMP